MPPASKILKGEKESKAPAMPVQPASQRGATGDAAETGGVSHQRGDEPGGCPDLDPEHPPQQEGGLMKKPGWDCHYILWAPVKSAELRSNL